LIITINDASIGDLPLSITISDRCKNQTKRIDFESTVNLSSLIVSLGLHRDGYVVRTDEPVRMCEEGEWGRGGYGLASVSDTLKYIHLTGLVTEKKTSD
jgi:hypothetical protein